MSKKLLKNLAVCRWVLTIAMIGFVPIHESKAQSSGLFLFLKQFMPPSQQRYAYGSGSFANVAEKLLPTVVNISTSRTVKPGQQDEDDEDNAEDTANNDPDSPFEKFFHNYMNRKGLPDDGLDHLQALGSGFIIDSTGLIVTNYHVIKDADEVLVTLQDNRTLKATLKGYDERTDIALLKIKSETPLKVAHFGNSDHSRVGDWVLAIGNPYGLSGTVTFGIISSRGRDIEQGPYDDFIQTDAPINKGNSGGPLFNIKGEVIGINTAIFSPSGGSIGIAFAIPSNEAKGVIEQLRTKGKVVRGWIGVHMQDINESIANSLNVQPFQGALIVKIEKDSPAEKAGLQAGDIIQKVNGKGVTAHTMPRMIAVMPADTRVNLTILRRGKVLNLFSIVKNLEDNDQAKDEDHANHQDKTIFLKDLDISVSMITDLLRQKYNLSEKQQGLVVVTVHHKEKNLMQRLKPGDVIVGTNTKSVTDIQTLKEAIQTIKKEKKKRVSMLLLVQSGSIMHWVAVPFVSEKSRRGNRK